MALLRVQKSSVGASTGSPDTSRQGIFAADPVIGNGIVVIMAGKANSPMTACVDNYGNTYQVGFAPVGANSVGVAFWFCPKITATGPTFTVTASGPSTYRMVVAVEISGVAQRLAVGRTTQNQGAGIGTMSTGTTAALTEPESMVFAAIICSGALGALTISAGTPTWIEEAEVLAAGNPTAEVDSRLVTGATAQSATWTWAGAINNSCGLVTFHAVTTIAVPDLTGLTQAEAIAAILAAGLVPGQVLKEKSDKIPPGQVIRQDPPPIVPVPPSTPINLVVSGGAGNGVRPLAMLPGKVNANNELLVSTTVPAARTASLDGAVALTDAVLIPAPGPTAQIVVTRLTVSAQMAGAFTVAFRIGPGRVLGPIWIPGSGPLAVPTDRVFSTGPIRRALPPGQGLTVTTSAAGPQTIDAEYSIVGDA